LPPPPFLTKQREKEEEGESQRMYLVKKQTPKLLSPAYEVKVIELQHLLSTIPKSTELWKSKVLCITPLAATLDLN